MDTTKIIYKPNGGQLFTYPMMAVFAPSKKEADLIADSPVTLASQRAYCELALDCAEAQNRLGIWGRPDLAALIERGD